MKKKIWIIVASLLFVVVLGIGIMIISGKGYVKGRLMKNENSYMILNEKDAMYFSITKGMEKRLEKMSSGDEIVIVHGFVEESFPARTDAKILIKLSDGEESDLPQDTIAQFTAPVPYQPGYLVTSSHEDYFISLEIPEGWEYEVKEYTEPGYQEFGISFWPEGQAEGKLSLMCAGKSWGVCGTGLTTKEVLIGEYSAIKYIYDNEKFWTFIKLDYPEQNYVVYNEGADVWLEEYQYEAMQILSTVQLPKGEVNPITTFGVELFKASMDEDKNTLVAPLSVMYCLGMAANGAEGETLEQMESVLGMNVHSLNSFLYNYKRFLPQDKKYELLLANSIWFTDDERFTVNEEFLNENETFYDADVFRAAFDKATCMDINKWVKKNTNKMIPEILDEIPDDAVMYLINALAFEAEWQKRYEDYQVSEGTFTLEDGTTKQLDYMYSEEYNYIEDETTIGFLKYYADEKYAFVALLPQEGISMKDYVENLNGAKVTSLLVNRQEAHIHTKTPKFETGYDLSLNMILEKMGMTNAFSPSTADFSSLGTSSAGNIYINRVLHKTFISVDTNGTKAGAATIAEVNDSSAYVGEIKLVELERPFVYMLVDCENNVPFFIGTMMGADN